MKVLWLSHLVPYPPKGGVLQRSYNLINELAKYADVHLVAFVQKSLINTFYEDFDEGLKDCHQELLKICDEVAFVNIPQEQIANGMMKTALKSLFSSYPYTVNWLISEEFEAQFQQQITTHSFDAIHVDTISLAYYTRSITDIPLILDHHNVESNMMYRRSGLESKRLKKWYFRQEAEKLERFEQQFCPQFDMNITCSTLDSERLLDVVPGITVDDIPNGVDTSYFKQQDKNQTEPRTMIFAGRLNAYTNRKAVLYFIDEIWPLLKQNIPDLKFYVVGSNPPESIQDIDPDIIVTGFVDDVRPYLEQADIYVCPITDGGGTKLKVLDALAMGKPIVGNIEAFEGIDIEHGVNAYVANSAEEYLSAIQRLIDDDTLKQTISLNACQLARDKYDYVSIGKKLFHCIESIAK